MASSLYWGPVPDELDGGAAVAYWQLLKMHKTCSTHKFFGVPKIPFTLNASVLPFVKFLETPDYLVDIPKHMQRYKIPLLWAFHIGEHISPLIDPIHKFGGKVLLWQTVHWADDLIFKAKNLCDLDYTVAVTDYAKELLISNGGIKPDKIETIYHGIDTTKFYPQKTLLRKKLGLEKRNVVLFMGRFDLWKGIHSLIPILRPMTENFNCTFLIRAGALGKRTKDLGSENKAEELYEIFRRIALRNKNVILFDKWVPYSALSELVASADLLVAPNGHEGFDVPLAEAMACGVVPIASDIPNHREVVGDCGLFVEVKDVAGVVNASEDYKGTQIKVPSSDSIMGAIQWLIENPEERKVLSEKSRKFAVERYSLDKISKRWVELLTQFGK